MINLFIDTSDKDVSIGIIKENQILAQKQESIPNQHSIYTTSYIKQVLDQASLKPEDIDRIIVVTGPGSFTGIRIGVTIAKVYAYLLKKEIIGVSSLKILALSTEISDDYLAIIDAKHDNYYIGLYDKNYENKIPETFANIEQVKKIINQYHPKIVSNKKIILDQKQIPKTNLDLIKIVDYYKDTPSENPHLVNPNYLKQPQALEKSND